MSTNPDQISPPYLSSSNTSTQSQPHIDFHARLNKAAGEVSYRKLGRLTDTHPETVRRYMQGQAPSATFMTNLCQVMGISGEWLLTGKGPMKCAQMRSHALSQADPSELMTAVANTLTDLCDRMDRLERYVQGLESQIRGGSVSESAQKISKPKAIKLSSNPDTITQSVQMQKGDHERSTQSIETKPGIEPISYATKQSSKTDLSGGNRAQRIRSAIAKRPSRDAG